MRQLRAMDERESRAYRIVTAHVIVLSLIESSRGGEVIRPQGDSSKERLC